MNKLNEFLNLEMKILMITQKTSIIDISELFHHTALTENYCMKLKVMIETVFEENNNTRYQIKNASIKVHHLTYQIAKSRLIIKHSHKCSLLFQFKDILQHKYEILKKDMKRFNHLIVEEK